MSTAQKTPGRARGAIMIALKVLVAGTLIGWLIRAGTLDFGALGILFRRPKLLAETLGLFVLAVLLTTLRWRALLGLVGIRLPFLRSVQLQLTAQFFNVVIPGSVGGDVVKALYVARDAPPSKRTSILLIVFVERLLGLAGLVTMATVITTVRGAALWRDPLLRPLAIAVVVLGAGTVLAPAVAVFVIRRGGDRIEAWTSGPSRLSRLLSRLVAALRLLTSGPKYLLLALGYSMASHGAAMLFFTILAQEITGVDVGFASIATVFPLGLLTLVLPISPSGLGVGHVAFERLFSAIGLQGGATVFNVYLLGQIAPNLFGAIPYLALKRSGALPTGDPSKDAA